MTGEKSTARKKGKAKADTSNQDVVPSVYEEMLAEALPIQADVPERPLKRRRIGSQKFSLSHSGSNKSARLSLNKSNPEDEDDVDDNDKLQLEDALDPDRSLDAESRDDDVEFSHRQLQTAYRESEDDSEESDVEWEGVNFDTTVQDGEPGGNLEFTLGATKTPQRSAVASKRKILTKAERGLRLQIHKLHILCLLSYVDRRNDWCSDPDVQEPLRPFLSKKTLMLLRPKSDLSQFGRTESLKRGLAEVSRMWKAKFSITARGMRRSLWAGTEQDLKSYKLPPDADSCFDKSDFMAAAKELKGSRDVGAQLFCALLRSVGVETRLVCSLQPLPFNAGGPAMPPGSISVVKGTTPETVGEGEFVSLNGPESPFETSCSTGPILAPRRRLGHPNAADYHIPDISTAPVITPPRPKAKAIHESPYPVFWVEVLDDAHQKWLPLDPLVTETVAKPRAFEPPVSDRENNMSYVIAFEEEGCARDVTRRYAKAYNAKTRKTRVESTEGGSKWWSRTMTAYFRGWKSDLDQIEDTELAASEAREPMPKNVADFKDHPYYALERHLRRNEVLISTREIGKVAAGRDLTRPGQKKLENVYRRRDVRIVRSADAWYRLGREVKMGEQPVKTVAAKRSAAENEDFGDDAEVEERAGTNLYTEEQTELYQAPPIVNGRVPKNSYGNLDLFVPSMVPRGGVHLPYNEASRAARLLGIDYADALVGFEFRGRHGTAILKGVVVDVQYREAVEAVIDGFSDEKAQAEEELRTLATLRMWKRFLVGLRIKERVGVYEADGEKEEDGFDSLHGKHGVDESVESEEYSDDDAGGFFTD